MESVSRSPIYTHFGETITGDPDSTDVHRDINLMVMSTTTILTITKSTGAPTIRAFNRTEDFITENEVFIFEYTLRIVLSDHVS